MAALEPPLDEDRQLPLEKSGGSRLIPPGVVLLPGVPGVGSFLAPGAGSKCAPGGAAPPPDDDGVGPPDVVDASASLGQSLVETLAQQLGGEVSRPTGAGAVTRIRIATELPQGVIA